MLLLPTDLADGDYELTITTQFAGTRQLKEARSVSVSVHVGKGGDDEDDRPVIE